MRKLMVVGVSVAALLGAGVLFWLLQDEARAPSPEVAEIAHEAPLKDKPLDNEPAMPLPERETEPRPEMPAFEPETPGEEPEPEAELETPEEETPRSPFRTGRSSPASTVVIVKFENSTCLPESTWLAWEDGENAHQEGADFDAGTRKARIDIFRYFDGDRKNEGKARAYCNWFGTVLASEVFEVTRDESTTITLTAPEGAELLVRVLGPDGRAMQGVLLETIAVESGMQATTDAAGEARFSGIPAPSKQFLKIENINGAECCTPRQEVSFSTIADRQTLLFDLTGTGVVECELTADGKSFNSLDISSLADSSRWRHVRLWHDDNPDSRIYGLKPGKYSVVVDNWAGLEFTREFEVQNPPLTSKWHHNFETRTLTVQVHGAPSSEEIRLYYWSGWSRPASEVHPQASGGFVINGLSGPIWLHARGGGWASRPYEVNPAETGEVAVEVVPAGTLQLIARSERAHSIKIKFADGGSVRVAGGNKIEVELPPGDYTVESRDFSPGETEIAATVTVGETTEARYGAEYITTLELRSRDRRSLWKLDVTIQQDGKPVTISKSEVWSGGDQYFRLEFQAEGKLTLRIKGESIEELTRHFEVTRGQTLRLEIDIKDKQ